MNVLPKYTGQQVKYYAFCHRRLWLFSHDIAMEKENEDVQKGSLLDETSYAREHKSINIDDRIVIDWIGTRVLDDGTLLIHEVKKSKSFDQAHRLQVLYYLFYLQCKGVKARGEIDYPLLKKTEKVELTPEAQSEVGRVLDGIQTIVEQPEAPPRLENKRLCEKCAYFELCWS
jgi:CRISPR-associated exonuclease Cas4